MLRGGGGGGGGGRQRAFNETAVQTGEKKKTNIKQATVAKTKPAHQFCSGHVLNKQTKNCSLKALSESRPSHIASK